MKMKKLAAVALAVVMSVSMLAGCGSSNDKKSAESSTSANGTATVKTAKDAKKLLLVPEEEINKQMKLTGKAARWQEIHKDFVRFGSLSELMYDVEQMDAVRDERLSSDKSRLTEIMKNLTKQ